MLYYMAIIKDYFECSKYKKLYEKEKDKYEDLKNFTEQLVLSNIQLMAKLDISK